MMTSASAGERAGLLPRELALAEPDVAGPLTVFPLLAPPGALEYRSFAEASAQGFVVRERSGGASVNDLTAVNPLDVPVLLFEGEEVVGAQQDRTFDVSVLVPAGAKLDVPVSCVEHGRWDGSRHAEAFTPSERAAFPALRAAKNRVARARLAAGLDARADQGEVWDEVEAKGARMAAESPTGAMGGIFEGRAGSLDALAAEFRRRDGQVGMLACLDGRPAVLDLVSRSDVFASLFAPLLRGYCLDALEHDGAAPLPVRGEDAGGFLASVSGAAVRRRDAVGLGEWLAFTTRGAGGSGLAVDGELIGLTAFAEDGPRPARILRPSRTR